MMRRTLRVLGWGVAVLTLGFMVLLVVSRDARFVVRAGFEELRILMARQDLQDLLDDPDTQPEDRDRFALVLDVRAFAADSLGLAAGRTFTQYSVVPRDTLVLVLSASPRHRLEAYTWWFPVVGRVPYRGYFDRADAEDAAGRLAARGYDTYVRPASAFSTLGWFEDPLLSTVMRRGPVSLAELVVHEITHNTVWVAGSAPFNESLASFVGFRGTEAYYRSRGDTLLAQRAAAAWRDEIRLASHYESLIDDLKQLYDASVDLDDALTRRDSLFEAARQRFRDESFEVYDGERIAQGPLNNATIVATQTYRQQLATFDAALARFAGDLRATIQALRSALADGGDRDPFAVVEALTRVY